MKTFIVPAFLPEYNTTIYRIHVNGFHWPFETPVVQKVDESSVVVHPFQDSYGNLVITMEPAVADELDDGWDSANVLDLEADRVHDTITSCPADSKDYLVACIMLAWHLIDSHASIAHLSNDLNFFSIDVAVWAALAFFRNQDALRGRVSKAAERRYLEIHSEFMTILFIHGVKVHASIYRSKERGGFSQKQRGAAMSGFDLAFISKDSPVVYRVEVSGYENPFDSPRYAYDPDTGGAGGAGEIVYLSQDPGSVHVMQPLPRECFYCPQYPQHVGNALGQRTVRQSSAVAGRRSGQ